MAGVEADLEQCGRHEEAIKRLDGWQAKQNGSLQRLEAKLEGNNKLLIGALVTLVLDLVTRFWGRLEL